MALLEAELGETMVIHGEHNPGREWTREELLAVDTLGQAIRENGGAAYLINLAAKMLTDRNNQRREIERLRASLRRIAGMAGAPDAAEACRNIIAEADDAEQHRGYCPYCGNAIRLTPMGGWAEYHDCKRGLCI